MRLVLLYVSQPGTWMTPPARSGAVMALAAQDHSRVPWRLFSAYSATATA